MGTMIDKDNIHRYELAYILDAPYAIGLYFLKQNNLRNIWHRGSVVLTDTKLLLPYENGWKDVPLSSIEMPGRMLDASTMNDVLETSGYPSVLVVDYTKQSTFSKREIISIIIFAGEKNVIRDLTTQLKSSVSLSKYRELKLTQSDKKFLYLLSEGVKENSILLMLFGGNGEELHRSCLALQHYELCTKSADLTPGGSKLMTAIKPLIEAELGMDVITSIKRLGQGEGGDDGVTVSWSDGEFYTVGRVKKEKLWQHIPFSKIKDVEMLDMATQLLIATSYGATLRIESSDPRTIMSIFNLIQSAKDKAFHSELRMRILDLLSLINVRDIKVISNILKLPENEVKAELDWMINNKVINTNYKPMVPTGQNK